MTAVHVFDAGFVPEGHEVVIFVWSAEHGQCYECGIPAAFVAVAPDEHRKVEPHQLRCAVCAANAAADGAIIHRLFEDS